MLVDLGEFERASRQYDRLLDLFERADWWAILSGLNCEVAIRRGRGSGSQINRARLYPEPLINLALVYQEKADLDTASAFCRQQSNAIVSFQRRISALG